MTPRDWFGVAVRVIGVWILFLSSDYMLGSLDRATTSQVTLLFPDEQQAARLGLKGYVFFAIGYGVLGFYLLLKADSVTNLAYGRLAPDDETPEDSPQDGHDTT